jgi:DNA-binding LacI/PurR family transcriptional regulator
MVRQAMAELGYVPSRLAQSFARGSSRTIAVLVDGEGQSLQGNAFLMTIALGLNDVLADADYSIRIVNGYQAMRQTRQSAGEWTRDSWMRREFDGVVITNPTTTDALIEAIVEMTVPAVVIGRYPNPHGLIQVDVDNIGGTRLATAHLLNLGHRRVAFLGPPDSLTVASDRRQGYLEALARAGIKPESGWMLETSGTDLEAFSFDAAHHTMVEALGRPWSWTAIVAFNDEMALGAVRALVEQGVSLPTEVSIVGFDDLPYARMVNPPLSTVHQDIRQLGQHAGRALLAALRGQKVADLTIQTVSFVERASTAVAPASAGGVAFLSEARQGGEPWR